MSDCQETTFEVWWHGPYTFEELKKKKKSAFARTLKLYAVYGDHPLYGRQVLTYIGKAVRRDLITRLSEHNLEREPIYVANVMRFDGWAESNAIADKDGWDPKDFLGRDDEEHISRIEELLIYGLWPAGNLRNKNTARHSSQYRIFNTGELGSLPPELSGGYMIEKAPLPDEPG